MCPIARVVSVDCLRCEEADDATMRSDPQICRRTHFIYAILIIMCVCRTLSTLVQILTDLPTVVVDCDTDVPEIILQQKYICIGDVGAAHVRFEG